MLNRQSIILWLNNLLFIYLLNIRLPTMRIHLTKVAALLAITTLTLNALGRPIDIISDASDLPNLIALYKNGDYKNAYKGLFQQKLVIRLPNQR